MYLQSSLLLGEVHLRWRGVATQIPPSPQSLTLFYLFPRTKQGSTIPLSLHLKATTEPLKTKLRHNSTTQLETAYNTTKLHATPRIELQGDHFRLGLQ